ncbi:MAG: Protein phosphatase 2C-like [Frankiales bacterium]|nr:Protein phosphatase 2C-like [Frankiales bacterium]
MALRIRQRLRRSRRRAVSSFVATAVGSRWVTPAVLAAVIVLITAGAIEWDRQYLPPSALTVPLIATGLFTRWRVAIFLCSIAAAGLVIDIAVLGIFEVRIGSVVAIGATVAFALVMASTREQVGAPGFRGEHMLLELRDRLSDQGTFRDVPDGWSCESTVSPAGTGVFGGDFLVSLVRGHRLEMALIDVSGKGIDAGTRALLLSGAFGGLLGAVPPGEFLCKANEYLLRQDWEEGFATAIHLTVDLSNGEYLVENAGHPPAVRYDAGSGSWHVSEASGVALGLLPTPSYSAKLGVLRPGDALLLYTDGLVEESGRDLSVGIDRLMGAAEKLISRGFSGASQLLVDRVAQNANDDRALVVLWRG